MCIRDSVYMDQVALAKALVARSQQIITSSSTARCAHSSWGSCSTLPFFRNASTMQRYHRGHVWCPQPLHHTPHVHHTCVWCMRHQISIRSHANPWIHKSPDSQIYQSTEFAAPKMRMAGGQDLQLSLDAVATCRTDALYSNARDGLRVL